MGQSQSNQKPESGDLIEISRVVYSHWAVYVGDGDVVHVTAPPDDQIPGIVSNSLMSVPTEKAVVKREKLQTAVGNNKWRINNILDHMCKPRPAPIIVKEALTEVGKMTEYSVTSKNCEHFSTKLRYGEAVSLQVIEAKVGIFYVPLFGGVWITSSHPVIAGAAALFLRSLQTDWQTFSSTSPPT